LICKDFLRFLQNFLRVENCFSKTDRVGNFYDFHVKKYSIPVERRWKSLYNKMKYKHFSEEKGELL